MKSSFCFGLDKRLNPKSIVRLPTAVLSPPALAEARFPISGPDALGPFSVGSLGQTLVIGRSLCYHLPTVYSHCLFGLEWTISKWFCPRIPLRCSHCHCFQSSSRSWWCSCGLFSALFLLIVSWFDDWYGRSTLYCCKLLLLLNFQSLFSLHPVPLFSSTK